MKKQPIAKGRFNFQKIVWLERFVLHFPAGGSLQLVPIYGGGFYDQTERKGMSAI